jgi:uncharacterized peroxidase-related enzyme
VRLSEREQVIAEVVDQLTANPVAVGDDQLERLKALGYSREAIIEILEISAFFSYANRLTIALNVVPDNEFFSSRDLKV